jgi:type VI protein secretion system component VasF
MASSEELFNKYRSLVKAFEQTVRDRAMAETALDNAKYRLAAAYDDLINFAKKHLLEPPPF